MPVVTAGAAPRLARLEQVVAALEETVRAQPDPPAGLREALAAFRHERDALRRAGASFPTAS